MSAPPLIVSHRGAKREAPENSASAFNQALTYPIDGIELDVQLSRDRVPIIYHDRTMWKIVHQKDRLKDYSYRELLAMDFGAWFDKKFQGEKVLTLSETLDTWFGRTRLFVEIKSRGWDRRTGTSHVLTRIVLSLLEQAVKKHGQREVFILSFDRKVLDLAMQAMPSWNYILNLISPAHLSQEDIERFSGAWGFCTNINRMAPGFSKLVHGLGKRLLTYTCNTGGQVERALENSVDVLMTDDPRWLFEYLKKRRQTP